MDGMAMVAVQMVPAELSLIDQDHDVFRHLIGQFHRALNGGGTAGEVARRRAALMAHVDAHMEFEERVMLDRRYPLLMTHAQQHKSFRDQITAVVNGLTTRTVTIGNLEKLLIRIHEHHLRNQDQVFYRYLLDRDSLNDVSDGSGI
jgi:hemerythrin-like metal-binding protein